MTEETVRAIFLKNYSGVNLNEALRVASEEISLAILAEGAPAQETLPDIVRTIIGGKSRVGFFSGLFVAGMATPGVPMSFIVHFDHVRKAMLDAVVYMRDNYDSADQFFRNKFTTEELKMMSADMSEAIEKPTGLPANVRALNFAELKKEDEFFSFALVGILGTERFKKYAIEYNVCSRVLRQCQAECKVLGDMVDAKES